MTSHLARRGWHGTHAAQCAKLDSDCKRSVLSPAVSTVARRTHADRVACHERRSQFVDDHRSLRLDPRSRRVVPDSASRALERDAIGRAHAAKVGQIRTPRSQRPNELHTRQRRRISAARLGAHDRVLNHLQCDATRCNCCLATCFRTRRDSIIPSRLFGVTVRLPAKAACAAFWASRSSSLPRRRRSCLSVSLPLRLRRRHSACSVVARP